MKKMMRKHSKNFLWLTYFSDFVALVFAHSQHTGIVLFTTEIEYLKAIFENKYRYNYSLHRYWTLTGYRNFRWTSKHSCLFMPAKIALHLFNIQFSRKEVNILHLFSLVFDFPAMFLYAQFCLSYEQIGTVSLNMHLRSWYSSSSLLDHLIRSNKLHKKLKAAVPQQQ